MQTSQIIEYLLIMIILKYTLNPGHYPEHTNVAYLLTSRISGTSTYNYDKLLQLSMQPGWIFG